MVIHYQFGDVLHDSLDGFHSVFRVLHEEVFEMVYHKSFHFFMLYFMLSLCIFKRVNVVMLSVMHHRFMKEYHVSFSFPQPLNP